MNVVQLGEERVGSARCAGCFGVREIEKTHFAFIEDAAVEFVDTEARWAFGEVAALFDDIHVTLRLW